MVKAHKNVCPWLTRDHIMNKMRSRAKLSSSIRVVSDNATTNGNVVDVSTPVVVSPPISPPISPPVSPNSNTIVLFHKAIGGKPVRATNK